MYSAINRPNGGHFETHIPGSEYLEGIDPLQFAFLRLNCLLNGLYRDTSTGFTVTQRGRCLSTGIGFRTDFTTHVINAGRCKDVECLFVECVCYP